jgi:YD repeat-containing protein
MTGAAIATYGGQDRLQSYGGATFTYTANGELQSKTQGGVGSTYQYDELGNLLQAQVGATTLDYVIDGQNRRVGRKVNGVLVQGCFYQDQLKPVAELDGAGAVRSCFVDADKVNVPKYMVIEAEWILQVQRSSRASWAARAPRQRWFCRIAAATTSA